VLKCYFGNDSCVKTGYKSSLNASNAPKWPKLKVFVRQRKVAAEATDVTANDLGDGAEFLKRRVTLAPFHATNVAWGCVGPEGKVFL
jgi:hypothetical protein